MTRTEQWRRYPAREGQSAQRARPLVLAHCAFTGTTALVEVVNRRGTLVTVRVHGVEPRPHLITIEGNSSGAFPFTVAPGAEVEVRLTDEESHVLYQGVAPEAEPESRSTDGQDQRTALTFPGSGSLGGEASHFHTPES